MKDNDHKILEEAYNKIFLKENGQFEENFSDDESETSNISNVEVDGNFEYHNTNFYTAAKVDGIVIINDDSFDHEFGTEKRSSKSVELTNYSDFIILYDDQDGNSKPLSPETFGARTFVEISRLAKATLEDIIEKKYNES